MEDYERLEHYIADTFPAAEKTKNSGRSHRDGDVLSPDFLLDGKVKGSTSGASITGKEIQKTLQQAIRKDRKPAWVVQNREGKRFMIVNYEHMVMIMKELQGYRDTGLIE